MYMHKYLIATSILLLLNLDVADGKGIMTPNRTGELDHFKSKAKDHL